MAEQFIRNEQVVGSIPTISSRERCTGVCIVLFCLHFAFYKQNFNKCVL